MGSRSPKTKGTLLASVLPLVKEQQRLARLAVQQYSPEVDSVIRERSRDSKRIERLLDGMLGFGFDGDMLLLYKKLCRYYLEIDPQGTAFYVHAYRDMWDDAQAVKVGGK